MLPRVIIHNWVSADGRLDWVRADMGLFYGLAAATWKEDATLVGCDTILHALAMAVPESADTTAQSDVPQDRDASQENAGGTAGDPRPLLAVVDSRGRIHEWPALRQWPYWRKAVALCSQATPASHLLELRGCEIETIQAGGERVDLREALHELRSRHGVQTVRVDSGGSLNGALLRAGLVDEISLLIEPSAVGGSSSRGAFHAPDLDSMEKAVRLTLRSAQPLAGDVVWLRYDVRR